MLFKKFKIGLLFLELQHYSMNLPCKEYSNHHIYIVLLLLTLFGFFFIHDPQ